MITVPLVGLLLILLFFDHYASTIEKKPVPANMEQKQLNTVYKKSKSSTFKPVVVKQQSYIQSEEIGKRISIQSKPTYRKKQYTNYHQADNFVDAETLFQQDQLRQKREKQEYQNRIRANKYRLQARKLSQSNNNADCSYISKMKKRAEEIMRRGYKAYQFQRLENNRKFWAKKYSDNCFNR